ncbi:MAG: GDP-mannose 4,6-dehydratase [Opitutales bacterium]|nr:GDP-mannose 4,6-dehydratase [Opitutales bacterium]
MKVLITGGAGFIGSHLAERYLELGHKVYVIDDLSTGRTENISHLQQSEKYDGRFFFTHDTIFNDKVLLDLVGICDLVVHLAAAVGVEYILNNPLSSLKTNIGGTEKILELCHRFQKKVLLASTSEVYGNQTHAPLKETDGCTYGPSTKARWSYAASKLLDEFMALGYHRTEGLPVVIVRFFNTVGPKQTGRYGMVIPRLVDQALKGETLTVYGDGSQSRTFTHVKDVVEALVQLLETPEAEGEVVNIGGVEETSILNLAQRIIKKTDSKSKINLIPYDVAFSKDFEDMQRRVPSTEKLNSLTGFRTSIKLDEILNDVIEDRRSNLSRKLKDQA